MEGAHARRVGLAGLAGAAALAVVVRVPLFGVPLDPDEGGYAFVAHRWAGGAVLYADAWVDRPQGLMLLFRAVDAVAYSPAGIRAAAMVVAAVLAVVTGTAAWALAGPRAATMAAVACAVVAAGPWLQGYELNGELAASAVGTTGVALALVWRARRGSLAWLVAAGLAAGAEPLMKQSGLDAAVVVVAVVAGAGTGRRARAGAAAAAGLVAPVALAAAWGAATVGLGAWWFAVAGFQRLQAGEGLGARLASTGLAAATVAPDLALLAAVGVWGAVRVGRRGDWLPAGWLGAAAVCVLAGPYGHPHYWVQLVAPASVAAAAGLAAVKARRALAALAAVLVLPVASQLVLVSVGAAERTRLVVHDPRLLANPAVSAWLRAHTRPGQQVYALAASADLYLHAGRSTDYRYLWLAMVDEIPGAVPAIRAYLAGPAAPAAVVEYQSPDAVDPSGRLATLLAARYRRVTTIDGFPVLTRAPTRRRGEG